MNPIQSERRERPTPKSLVENGKANFGTFSTEFELFDLEAIKKAHKLPDVMNKLKLTQWEAFEVRLDQGYLLCAICHMGAFGKVLHIWHDTRTNTTRTWDFTTPPGAVKIARNLKKGNKTEIHTKKVDCTFTNLLERNTIRIQGKMDGLEYDFKLKRLSRPSIVSIPLGPNRPLYTQKDWLTAYGKAAINGKTYGATKYTTAVLDDHRGYYPRKMHYDWVTVIESDIAVNLTQNQSTDPARYNENLIWTRGKKSLLPPVWFQKDRPTYPFSNATWKINDQYGKVDLTFRLDAISPMVLKTGIVNIDYHVVFGKLSGTVTAEDGTRYEFREEPAMGEDKTLLF